MVEKEYGSLKIAWHPEKLKSFCEGNVSSPLYIRIKPTNKCNHSCFYCVYEPDFSGIHCETSRTDEIPYEKMMEILDNLKEMGVKAVTYSGGGEPLVYPWINEVLKKTAEYGIDFSMITNGQNLRGENAVLLSSAKWIRISSDSSDSKTFSEIRRRPEHLFNEIVDNIKNFVRIKSPSCILGINFVVHEKNKERIYDAVKFYKELGVNHIKFSAAWKSSGFEEYHEKIREVVSKQIKEAKRDFEDKEFGVYDTYERDLALTGSKNRNYKRCYVMQTIPVIGADCNVYFCHNKAYDSTGVLGSIKKKSFKNLWFSKQADEKFRSFNPSESCKHQCTNDMKNILINDILNCYGEHVNFV